ncbi:hypothetical protein VTN77DRAFT_3571 [Rasamsonia byssochlamydoides]|uniref:mitochondrial 37S ribosomal protein bS21m n=1 Tax=Rasamsonia byssochlamydoides TaxID=89139 RepID=UPI003742AD76
MAARALVRCLRSTPSSLFTRPSTITTTRVSVPQLQLSSPIRGQVFRLQSVQYSSSPQVDSNPADSASEKPAEAETSPSPSEQTSSDNTSSPSQQTSSELTSSNTPTNNETAAKSNASLADFDEIFNKLEIGNRDAADTTQSMKESSTSIDMPQRRPYDPSSLSRAVAQSAETDNYRSSLRRVELKLGPELGRQVYVEPEKGVDLPAALRFLQINCAVNRVRAQANFQRFHVRRGQRKKDLRMERWRKLFKFSFVKTVAKIQRMRAQGW